MASLKYVIILATILITTSHNISFANNYSLYATLDYYGFNTSSQKKSLENLMHYANILKNDQKFDERYSLKSTPNELLKDSLDFVQQTQGHFFSRKNTQERWKMQESSWIQSNNDKIIEDLKNLGFVNAIAPYHKESDAVCILGATFSTMQDRINFIAEYLNSGKFKTKNIILLAGERRVTIGVDGTEQTLLGIAKKHDIGDLNNLTETHLIQEAFKDSTLNNKYQTYVIDAPAGNLPRPTTETTIVELIKWLNAHQDIKKITFISSQPYVKYQEAVISEILKSYSHIDFEVIGPEVNKDTKSFKILEGLGSYIWAKTPAVISQLGTFTNNDNILQEFKKLYSKNPLIYSDIENLFKINP